ncbi:hypothetical protein ACM9HF_00085 [Colwellia sp. RE-S-Sl-9]
MLKGVVTFLILIFSIYGCSSYSELKKSSANHTKSGDYYESIGQPEAAREERQLARKDRKNALKLEAVLAEVINNKDKIKN